MVTGWQWIFFYNLDPEAVRKAEEAKARQREEEEAIKVESVAVPTVDDEEIEQFFSVKEINEISDKVEMDVDDFNDIFIEANEM